jgi:hypothetical protein
MIRYEMPNINAMGHATGQNMLMAPKAKCPSLLSNTGAILMTMAAVRIAPAKYPNNPTTYQMLIATSS